MKTTDRDAALARWDAMDAERLSELSADEARERWLDVLRDASSKKAKLQLARRPIGSNRCCLGHACFALGYSMEHRHADTALPDHIAATLDITPQGRFRSKVRIGRRVFDDLAEINDLTTLKPAQIADVIEREFKNENLASFAERIR